METFLTVLMWLGIYVVFPLIVAAGVCGAVILKARLQAKSTEAAATGTEVKEAISHPAKM